MSWCTHAPCEDSASDRFLNQYPIRLVMKPTSKLAMRRRRPAGD
jgi:hypothetical protein